MPLLTFGDGCNLDTDPTSLANGSLVTLINAYKDRAGAIRSIIGCKNYATIANVDLFGANVWLYDSKNFETTLAVCNGIIYKQSDYGSSWTEITGTELDSTVKPTFAEDKNNIFIAADSAIYKFDPTGTTAVVLGQIEDEETEEEDFTAAFVIEGEFPNPRLITILSDKAKSIYYTIDGSAPSTSSTEYAIGTKISVATSLTIKAIAYDGNDNPSNILVEKITVDTTIDTDAPKVKTFTVGAVEDNKVLITKFTYSDTAGTTGWCITESATPPALNDEKWTTSPPTEYYSRTATAGARDLYPWVRDSAGNISAVKTPVSVTFEAAITDPDEFEFSDVTDTKRNIYIESEALQPQGITYQTNISVIDGEYAISRNGGFIWTNWRTASGTIYPGDVIKLRHTSSSNGNENTITTLTIGTIAGTFSSTTALSTVPRNVTHLAYLNGFILAKGQPNQGSGNPGDILFSDDIINNYYAWEYYNNSSNADKLQSMIVAFEQIYNIGTQTIEGTIFDGVTPFAVNRNSFQPYGTLAPDSVAYDGESIYFLSNIAGSPKVLMIKHGGTPQIISLPIDLSLEKMEAVTDARGFIIGFRGQNFYLLEFPTATAIIDDQEWKGITLAYHLQKQSWLIFGRYLPDDSVFTTYRGISAVYVERWGKTLIGGRDGHIYELYQNDEPDYVTEINLRHRWRDDHSQTWKNPRYVRLSPAGDYRLPPDQIQGGTYQTRQHELEYDDTSDAGDIMRAIIKSGWINHGTTKGKISTKYRYNIVRGKNGLTLNAIDEEINLLRR